MVRLELGETRKPITARIGRTELFLGDTIMLSIFRKVLKDESGATAIEYGLIAALISVAAITAFTTVGTKLSSMMTNTANSLK